MINLIKRYTLLSLLFVFTCIASAQTYQELTDQALEQMEKDSLATAEQLFREALKLEPTNSHNALLFSNIGTIQHRMRRYDEAIESFTYALNLVPIAVPILLNRATVYMEIGEANKAYVDYCLALDVDKENTEALLMRAYIYLTRKDYKAARIDYKRLLEIDPSSYSGQLGMANLNQKEGKYKEAIDIINNMMIANAQDATLYMIRADIERDMKQTDAALLDLEEAIRLLPSSPEAYLLRGEIYLEQNKKTLAKQDFEKAISLGVPQTELRDQLKLCK